MDATASQKTASTEPRKFRPGPLLDDRIESLMSELKKRDPSVEFSGVIRDGLLAFWPQISAYLLARQQTGLPTDVLVRLVSTCSRAIEMGVTPDQLDARLMQFLEELHSEPSPKLYPFPVGTSKPAAPGH